MGARLTLLRTVDDWRSYQVESARLHNIDPSSINWGTAPARYPCLVASVLRDGCVASCFVWVEDAVRLIRAAPREVFEAAKAYSVGQAEMEWGTTPTPVDSTASFIAQQKLFNHEVASSLMAIVGLMVDTAICKTKVYEDRLIASRAMVNQMHAEHVDSLKLERYQLDIMANLGPQREGA